MIYAPEILADAVRHAHDEMTALSPLRPRRTSLRRRVLARRAR